MTIKQNTVVSIHYELKNADGKVLDSSKDQEPLVYLHGSNNIVEGLEEELEGKKVDDDLAVIVSPEKGYGEPIEALIQNVPLEEFGADVDKVEVGMQFQAETERGPIPVRVTDVENKTVTVDGNHPLAGKELHFNVSVTEIRDASQEELGHGHVHGAGGHQH